MDTFVCKFYSTRNFKSYNLPHDWKAFGDTIDNLYGDLLRELNIKAATRGRNEYYHRHIMESEGREKFEHHVELACISTFKNLFDFLWSTEKTISAEKHFVKLLKIGDFPYLDWEVDIGSESHFYTVRERLQSDSHWEKVKAEIGNALLSAYHTDTFTAYKTLKYDPNKVEVRIVR